jgi:cysteine protease ATG4
MSFKLGINKSEKMALKYITSLFDIKFCIGMIGGMDQQGYYFVGRINKKFIFLDPHYVHNSVTTEDVNSGDINSFFCEKIQTLKISKLANSLSIGFYFTNISEFE